MAIFIPVTIKRENIKYLGVTVGCRNTNKALLPYLNVHLKVKLDSF